MLKRNLYLLASCIALSHPLTAFAFRSCTVENSQAFSAATRYVVGEIAFDHITGQASGTETTYNHANNRPGEFGECHVTYALSGSFESASGTLVLDARRTNHSATCPPELVAAEYPAERLYALVMRLSGDGHALVHRADSGELLARGEWSAGATSYKTREICTMF